jgi:N-acyl-D-aspartate/D-glutamate deacylase
MKVLDTRITGGTIIDGTGAPARRGDLGIRHGRIVAVGDVDEPARRTIDAEGCVVAPGFLDIHTHYDAQLLWDTAASPSPLHGVTTVVGGNCGFTLAPLSPDYADYLMNLMARVEGMPLQALSAGLSWEWRSFGQWLDLFEGNISVNAGFLAGHTALRLAAMGEDGAGRPATEDQILAMEDELRQAIAAGALGFSTSLSPSHNDAAGDPVPSRSASRHELLRLAAVVGGTPATTLEMIPRDNRFPDDDVELMVDLSLAADRPVNWNTLMFDAGDGIPERQLRTSDVAAARGGRVIALVLPITPSIRINLSSGFVFDMIPQWAPVLALPPDERTAALSDPEVRRRMQEGLDSADNQTVSFMHIDRMEIAEVRSPAFAHLEGRTVGEAARSAGTTSLDLLLDVAVADRLQTGFLSRTGSDDDASWERRSKYWSDPRTLLGASDAGAHLDMMCGAVYTTGLLADGVRRRGLISLEAAVHQLTDMPARLYGLRDRGRLAEGWHADVVVFDPATVGPHRERQRADLPGGAARLFAGADGIRHVLVNGVEVVGDGQATDDRPGTVLRSGRHTDPVRA